MTAKELKIKEVKMKRFEYVKAFGIFISIVVAAASLIMMAYSCDSNDNKTLICFFAIISFLAPPLILTVKSSQNNARKK